MFLKVFKVFLICFSLFFLFGCASSEFSFEKARIGLINDGGQFHMEDPAIFEKGETVRFVLFNVGPFTKGDNGLCDIGIDFDVVNLNGEEILSLEDSLGNQSRSNLEGGMAEFLVTSFSTDDSLASGNYLLNVTIYDKLDGNSFNVVKIIELIE